MWTSFSDRGDFALPLVATASSLVVTSIILRFLWKRYQLSPIPHPTPSSFFLGNLLDTYGQVATWHSTGTYPEPFIGWIKKYGNAVLLREMLNFTVLISDPKAIQYLYSTNANNYHRSPIVENLLADFTFGPGLLSTRGAVHDNYRKMLNPLFSASQIKSFVPIYEAQARHACDTVFAKAAASGEPINFILRLDFARYRLGWFWFNFLEHPQAHAAYQQAQLEATPSILIGLVMVPGFLKFPLPSFLRRRKAQVTLRQVVNDVIERKLAEPSVEGKQKDLLDLILPNATTREAVIHTMTFLSAGHETSSSALSWIFATISSHPNVILRLRQEYSDVIEKHGSLTTWEAVSQLTYTMAVIQETMRLNVVVHALARRICIQDDLVPMEDRDPIFIPSGTSMLVSVSASNRHPKYWANADAFVPERFIEGTPEWDADLKLRGGKSHAYYYLPFSIGSTNCIGQRFALVEMQVILALVVGQYDFKVTPSSNVRQRHNGVTMAPAKIEVTLERATTPVNPTKLGESVPNASTESIADRVAVTG
ncbi:hypothetical protein AeMF1_010864 [Aphanomyces euteiches]|nr:hypothetical protein AeMF1_010864 [Aphanomyces euteiches]